MSRATHLARRFVTSLWPAGPTAEDDAWAQSMLLPGEVELWRRMSRQDRRHAARVARRVETMVGAGAGAETGLGTHADVMGDTPIRPVLAAALLHDVGKTAAGLGTYGRVVATLSGAAGHQMAIGWSASRGFTRRVGLYLRHPELGGDMVALADGDPITEAWTREHHLPPEAWTVPRALGDVLKAADDD